MNNKSLTDKTKPWLANQGLLAGYVNSESLGKTPAFPRCLLTTD